MLSVKEDFSDDEREMFFKGKGCPACKGVPTYYCEECEEMYKAWMRRGMSEEEIEMVWEGKICPKCGGKLKVAVFEDEFTYSLVECDGALEEVVGEWWLWAK